MHEKESVRTELTPALAREFANMTPMPGERRLKAKRLATIRGWIREGDFMGVHWYKGIEHDGDKTTIVRLDGQHTSTDLCEIAEKEPDLFPQGLMATITTIEFDRSERAKVFNLFNNPVSARDNTDMMGIYRASCAAVANLPEDFLVKIANGIYAYNAGLDEDKGPMLFSPRERGIYFAQSPIYCRFAHWAREFSGSQNTWMLGKTGIVAEMLADFLKIEPVATEFWGYVMREDHPESDHDTRELARTLNQWKQKPLKGQDDFRKESAKLWKRFSKVRLLELPSQAEPAVESHAFAEEASPSPA